MITKSYLSDADIALRDLMVERVFGAAIGMMELLSIYLGDRFGFYESIAAMQPVTPGTLASHAGTNERYTQEWLEQQAVCGILDVEDTGTPETRRYRINPGHVEALTDKDSLAYVAPFALQMVGITRPLPALLDAFRSGGGVDFPEYGEEMRVGIEVGNRVMFINQLASEWFPAMPDIHARLQANPPARVADIGCGSGWSSISISQAYPNVMVDGIDVDEASIAAARINAERAGASDRLRFHLRNAGDPALSGQYDLACAFECIHDMSDPVATLQAMRNLVGAGGTVLIGDERVADRFTAPGDDIERLMYGYSVLHCLPVGMVEQPSAATGTVMRTATLERYAREAGFQDLRVLQVENDLWRFYRLSA